MKTGKIKVGLSVVVVALIMAFFIPAALFPAQTKAVCSAMYSFITRKLAWLMFACFWALVVGVRIRRFQPLRDQLNQPIPDHRSNQ